MNEELNEKLKNLAHEKTIAFCYSCYQDAPTGRCSHCMSDDLMRHLPSHGVEYGYDWVIKALLNEHVEVADTEESYNQMLEDCYGETTKIGFLTYSTSSAIKELDPIAYDLGKSDYESSLIEDGTLIEIGSHYYWLSDIENFLEEQEEAA